ncbi:hypothetical protein TUM12370_21170 [Salmonella enterica subsp. enterica serovar Choleraesuis]|nr:hypothetical protein TUM12370_21170 [Salmonella enterica subsp. enterica serovar Choleraesuis]
MKGKLKAILALLLLIILIPLTLLLTVAHWLPSLAGIWLPAGTRISMESGPDFSRHNITLPDFRYIAGDCELARVSDTTLSHPSRWDLNIGALTLNPDCIAKIPASASSPEAPRTLAQWQAMLPRSWVTINKLSLTPWPQYSGKLTAALAPEHQQLKFQGDLVTLAGEVKGRNLTISQLEVNVLDGQPPLALVGDLQLPLVPDGLPTEGHLQAKLQLPQDPKQVDASLEWQKNSGQLLIMGANADQPLFDLPWTVTADKISISDGRWFWPYSGFPLSGRVGINAKNWQQGLDKTEIAGRLNVLTEGDAGKGNIVLNFGPGKLSMTNSSMPLQASGQVKQQDLILYAKLPVNVTGPLTDPVVAFQPGALLRSQGRLVDTLNIDDVRLPLAGVKVTREGVDGRLQAILRAHENQMGDFVLHLDGKASQFLPDKGRWQWRYWGNGSFDPMHAKWDVDGTGDWHDEVITLNKLSTGFDQLQYGTMTMHKPRLVLEKPVEWRRSQDKPSFSGALSLDAGETTFSAGSTLPPSTLKFSVNGSDPTHFLYQGALNAQAIGPVRVNGRWDGERLRGQAWWPRQQLTVFQPLIPADAKLTLKDGTLYAQVSFSAATGQGFEAGGHAVLKQGSAWLPDNQINGVDFVLPFRFDAKGWQLGTRGPVRLRIAEIKSQFPAQNFSADLQGQYPWSDEHPLLLSNVGVEVLDGKISMQQLRMPQHDAALLRLENLSTSKLISAINVKQFAMSGRVNGALPLWLNHPRWIVKDGWLSNPGPLTLRLDKDMADAIEKDNIAAGVAINWLRYMEIAHSWTNISLDNLGVLSMASQVEGISEVDGKRNTVKLNYQHQENLFTLWRSLRFGDNLQSWLEQHMSLPDANCAAGAIVCKGNNQ